MVPETGGLNHATTRTHIVCLLMWRADYLSFAVLINLDCGFEHYIHRRVADHQADRFRFGPEPRSPAKHFLFYLRDETFECDADCVEPLVVLAGG